MDSKRSKQFMAYSYEQIMQAQYARIADEQAQAAADLEAGRVSEDAYRVTGAADRILQLDKDREALDRRAQGFIAQQQPQGNKYGLSKDEQDVARGMFGNDQRMTHDQRERAYAEQKEKLRYMRATGQYRDDQGSIRR
jgi:hypothetical protein